MPLHKLSEPFALESGEILSELELYYEIEGSLEVNKKIVWICHAFTGSATVRDWWPSLYAENGGFIDLKKHFVVCVNIPGSCYGSTGPDSINPFSGKAYGANFPDFNNRDVIKAFVELRKTLKLQQIDFLIGGSLGGQQALEWAIIEPEVIRNLVLVASNARHSAWGIAYNELQRLALDTTSNASKSDRQKSLALARSIAMLSYRSYEDFESSQEGKNAEGQWKISSYLNYQGNKFIGRFKEESYKILTKMMDNHDISENREEDIQQILTKVRANTLCIGINSDNLFPLKEQRLISDHIPGATLEVIESSKGHDAFLIEGNKISDYIKKHLSKKEDEDI